jgi:predicted  nucleic acid-binding Zn-ribbon protein
MKEALKRVCGLIKETGKINRSIVAKLTGILPLIRRFDSVQEELTKLRKTLQAKFKKLEEPEKQLDQKLDLFKRVAQVLEPAMIKKQDLVAKLNEQGVRVSSSFQLLLATWKREGLFDTRFGKGWYCLSAKGRNIAGLPPRSSRAQEPVEPPKSLKELGNEIASLKEKLQEAESKAVKLEAELDAAASKPRGKKRKQKSLSQLDLIIIGLYDARPRKLKKADIKFLLDKEGKTAAPHSLIVLLTRTGSKGMIASSGGWGKKEYWLTPKGEARAEQIRGLQPGTKINGDLYALSPDKLADEYQDILDVAYGNNDIDRQKLYRAQDANGELVWVWWGLIDQFIAPEQPLLGYLLKHKVFPEAIELPSESCFLRVNGEDLRFDPSEKADDRIVEFVRQNNRLPEQISV